MSMYVCMYVCMCVCVCMYIYIYRERERERVTTVLSNVKEYFYPTFTYTNSTLFCLLSEVT